MGVLSRCAGLEYRGNYLNIVATRRIERIESELMTSPPLGACISMLESVSLTVQGSGPVDLKPFSKSTG